MLQRSGNAKKTEENVAIEAVILHFASKSYVPPLL
jgi:hypothetical protein